MPLFSSFCHFDCIKKGLSSTLNPSLHIVSLKEICIVDHEVAILLIGIVHIDEANLIA